MDCFITLLAFNFLFFVFGIEYFDDSDSKYNDDDGVDLSVGMEGNAMRKTFETRNESDKLVVKFL